MFSSKGERKMDALLGANSAFRGNLTVKGTLRVDGVLEGDIETDWLILGEKGVIKGNISAKSVIIGGKIEGNVSASESLELERKGRIEGDIRTARLSVHEGGQLNGRATMGEGESKVVELKQAQ
ncbi:MAG: polymer-forming cytoskeletal protein [Actinomycetota bacterium]|nr:polymer-forming cytoskeletal protein [Actinomycetota bacterium]